jgi:putative ABC transport system substrate-binding protein
MRRREFLLLLGCIAAVRPVAAAAQQGERMRRIALLLGAGASDSEMRARIDVFKKGLRELGWMDGGNIRMDLWWFGGSSEIAAQYAKEIVSLAPEIIVAHSTLGIEAVLKNTRSIPTVFVMVGNPVGGGYVASLAHPGANVTGFSAFNPEITGKWMQVLKEIAPATKQVAGLMYPGYEFLWHGAETAAATMGLKNDSGRMSQCCRDRTSYFCNREPPEQRANCSAKPAFSD